MSRLYLTRAPRLADKHILSVLSMQSDPLMLCLDVMYEHAESCPIFLLSALAQPWGEPIQASAVKLCTLLYTL